MPDRLHELVMRLEVEFRDPASLELIVAIRSSYALDHVSYLASASGEPLVCEAGAGRIDGTSARSAPRLLSPRAAHDRASRAAHGFAGFEWRPATADRSDPPHAGPTLRALSIPIVESARHVATFTIASASARDDWERLLEGARTDLLRLAHYLHRRAQSERGGESGSADPSLSALERETLRTLAAGSGDAAAAATLGLSAATVRLIADSCRHKLGALTLRHAIALARRGRML